MPCGQEEDRERLMEQEGTTGQQGLQQACNFHKGTERIKEDAGVQGKTSADPVEGAFRDIKVAAQGRDRGKLPSDPGIKEADEEAQAVGGVRDDEGIDESMGNPAGAAPEGREGYHAVADAAVYVTDKVAFMGTIMGIERGRRTAVWAGRQFREVLRGQGGEDLIVIKMFDLLKSLANVQVKSYHNGECYIGPWSSMGQSLGKGCWQA